MTRDEIVTKVLTEGAFDSSQSNTSTATVQGVVKEKYKQAVVRSRFLKANVELGPVVAGVGAYVVNQQNVAEILAVRIAGVGRFTIASSDDLWDLQDGTAVLEPLDADRKGVFAQDAQADGTLLVSFFPIPDSSMAGASITARAAIQPADLVGGAGAGSTPVIPPDCHEALAHGAIGELMAEIEERMDSASYWDAKFEAMIQDLSGRAKSMVTGGPVQMQLA